MHPEEKLRIEACCLYVPRSPSAFDYIRLCHDSGFLACRAPACHVRYPRAQQSKRRSEGDADEGQHLHGRHHQEAFEVQASGCRSLRLFCEIAARRCRPCYGGYGSIATELKASGCFSYIVISSICILSFCDPRSQKQSKAIHMRCPQPQALNLDS